MRIVRGLLLPPALKLLNWLLKHDGNSVIIGGPLGWTWEDTIDDAHHGSLGSGLHADSHDRLHYHSLVGDGSPIALSGIPSLDAAKITSGRFGVSRLGWTSNRFLKGAGVNADPIEISGWQVITDTTLTSAATYVDFNGLDINTDGVYIFSVSLMNATATAGGVLLFVEGDTTTTHYNSQYFDCNNTTVSAGRLNEARLGYLDASAAVVFFCTIYRDKSGYARWLSMANQRLTTVSFTDYRTVKYNATVDNITTIRVQGPAASSLGIGSRFILCKVRTG